MPEKIIPQYIYEIKQAPIKFKIYFFVVNPYKILFTNIFC